MKYAVSLNSGTDALTFALHLLGVKKGDEVIISAFNCLVVPEVILFLKAKPIYVDIDKYLNFNTYKLKQKLNKNLDGGDIIEKGYYPTQATFLRNNIFIIEKK